MYLDFKESALLSLPSNLIWSLEKDPDSFARDLSKVLPKCRELRILLRRVRRHLIKVMAMMRVNAHQCSRSTSISGAKCFTRTHFNPHNSFMREILFLFYKDKVTQFESGRI